MEEFGFVIGDVDADYVTYIAHTNKTLEEVEKLKPRIYEKTGVCLEELHAMLGADQVDDGVARKIAEATGIELIDPVSPGDLAEVWIALHQAVDPGLQVTIDKLYWASLSNKEE